MLGLPRFGLDAYADLLVGLAAAGYRLEPVHPAVAAGPGRVLHLRHDIDFFIEPALEMAKVETRLAARSTYYVLLTGPYNPATAANRRRLRALVEGGHQIGLHYDLATFPEDPARARDELDGQVRTLSRLAEAPVVTISTHQPHLGGADPLRQGTGYTHPHDPTDPAPALYISDSCRGWRDDTLLRLFACEPPSRVMLLTHPELWQAGHVRDRRLYLRKVLWPSATRELERYYLGEVADIWERHAGGRAHDAREGLAEPTPLWPDRAWAAAHIAPLRAHFATFTMLPWTEEQILREAPGKWEHSLVVVTPSSAKADILGFSFNSLRDDALYIHAFFVAEESRAMGLGTRMLTWLEQRARAIGRRSLELRVDLGNDAALRWYLGRGFRVKGGDAQGGPLWLRKEFGERP